MRLLSFVVGMTLSGCSAGSGAGQPSDGGGSTAPTVVADGGPDSSATGDSSCGRYLACLLVTSPEAYGAAIQIYGDSAACWNTPLQAKGCSQACQSAFVEMKAQCECSGSTCTKCSEMPRGVYDSWEAGRQMNCDNRGVAAPPPAQEVRLIFTAGRDRGTTATIRMSDENSPRLEGTVACNGSFSVSGATTNMDYSDSWTVALTPTGDGESFATVITKKTIFTSGQMQTCTLSTTQTR